MINRQNYHWIKAYLEHLQTVMQINARSLERYWSYLRHALLWADETSFAEAPHIRPLFSAYLAEVKPATSGEPLASATVKKIVQVTQRFFRWAKLSFTHKFQAVSTTWIESLRPPRLNSAVKEHVFVTLDDIETIAHFFIPEPNVALRRDQACAAMLYLSGIRVGAMSTLSIEAVDLAEQSIRQWPSLGVHTKNGKAATTYLLPIPELLKVVQRWDAYVRGTLPPTAMWCPPVGHTWGDQSLTADRPGAHRTIAINKRLHLLFTLAGLPPQSPHKFRHGHAVWALQHARTMADYKAISQNLMHSDIRVTDGIYAPLLGNEVQQRVAGLAGQASHPLSIDGDLMSLLSQLSKEEIPAALHILANRLAQ
jgi:integrase